MLGYFQVFSFLVILSLVFSGSYSISGKWLKKDTPGSRQLKCDNGDYSVFRSLIQEKSSAQFSIISANSPMGEATSQYLGQNIRKTNPGVICLFIVTHRSQVKLTNRLQEAVTFPRFVAVDAEWGIGKRLTGMEAPPYPVTFGAITINDIIYERDLVIGNQLKELAVKVGFPLAVDVNPHPKNPLTFCRSLGEGQENVTPNGNARIRWLQYSDFVDNNVRNKLRPKYLVGLKKPKITKLEGIEDDLNNRTDGILNNKPAGSENIILHNSSHTFPPKNLRRKRIVIPSIEDLMGNLFQEMILNGAKASRHPVGKPHGSNEPCQLLKALENYDLGIFGIHGHDHNPHCNYGINREKIHMENQKEKEVMASNNLSTNNYATGNNYC